MALHRMPSRKRKRIIAVSAAGVIAVSAAIGVVTASAHGGPGQAEGPAKEFYTDIREIEPNVDEPELRASPGTFVAQCGNNENGHRNPDNFIVAPGVRNGAQHLHDYVGNLSTDADSDDRSLAAAGTTCRNRDQSTYFWPVLRELGVPGPDEDEDGGGNDGNEGEILPPDVRLEFRGNAKSQVTAMPAFLRAITGDAKAATNGDADANAKWTCTGFEDRQTTQYPLCPEDSQVQRVLDFPSCWDGQNTDSQNHRDHLRFTDRRGNCPRGTQAVPQLRMTLTYTAPNEPQTFAVDSFPDQGHNPLTDHADFANLMPQRLMDQVVGCINDGRSC
ncbi:DUF1996 domain-containing protein [Amycolatopsis nigrescens]|uniref:DUF1996 domain-containing protein n=1 Tax=Amycolatopsis nigrescens TaxID=381445 RepID=UPI00039F6E72|nr:DUF1996 domain-containing protein [Amycolatopsis nigrescens]